MKAFTRNLRTVMRAGELTVTDLAVWFDRPFHTVRHWVLGRSPVGAGGRNAVQRLHVLQQQFGVGMLPVPPTLTWQGRTEYINNIKIKALGDEPRISQARTAANRRLHRVGKARRKKASSCVPDPGGAVGVDSAAE